MRHILLSLFIAIGCIVASAQTAVSIHWPFSSDLRTEMGKATAAEITSNGTDLSSKFTTSVSVGSKLNSQGKITPQNSATGTADGLAINRFKTAGTADGSSDFGVSFDLKSIDEGSTFLPTKVTASVALWSENAGKQFCFVLQKIAADETVAGEYQLGTASDAKAKKAQYSTVSFDVPSEVTASPNVWRLVIKVAAGYNNGLNLALGNVTVDGVLQGGQTITTHKISTLVTPSGAGTITPDGGTVVDGEQITLTATPFIGYAFEGWYVDKVLKSNNATYTFQKVNNDFTAEARFTLLPSCHLTYGMAPSSTGKGTITVTGNGEADGEGRMKFNSGSTVTLKATAARGSTFIGWTDGEGNTLSTSEEYTFTIDKDTTAYALFGTLENYKEGLAAFPGAEGWGRFATGGRAVDSRGSKVLYVTRLDDCSDDALVEGTLRWALQSGDDTPRTILFNTCGTIYLTSKLKFKHGNISIEGQTAPGGGVCIAGYPLNISKPNIIIRHIRFRTGDLMNKSVAALDIENTSHVILDHCSITWSMEEGLTMYDCDSTTVQWTIIGEGLYSSKNAKGLRAYATQWGGEHGTMHHCLITNSNNRTPRFNGVRSESKNLGDHDQFVDDEFINNVIFNWGKPNSVYGGECYKDINGGNSYDRVYMINNYYRPGPATQNGAVNSRYFVGASSTKKGITGLGQWYLSGNKFEVDSKWRPRSSSVWTKESLDKVNADNLYGFTDNLPARAFNTEEGASQAIYDATILSSQTLSSGVSTETADEAFESVTMHAGATLPRTDEVDSRLLAEARGTTDPQFKGSHGSAGIIDSPANITLKEHDTFVATDEGTGQQVECTEWPFLGMRENDCKITDTDKDGLPDAYEREVGLNPDDPSDAGKLTTTGYSYLEEFVNGVADGTIDMAKYSTRTAVEPSMAFDAIVDKNTDNENPAASPAIFKTIQGAVDAANGTSANPYLIFVKAGTYNEHVSIDKPYTHITGQSKQAVVITDNKTVKDGGVDKTATVNVTASDVVLDNLTIANTAGNVGQALALYTKNDRIVITQCNINGYQDTYRTGKKGQRHLVRKCKITGSTDFIYNDGDVFFDADTLNLASATNTAIVAPDHITPTWGYVFRDATITADGISKATTNLGRPWGDTPKVSFINTTVADNVSINPEGWLNMGGLPIQMAEYNTHDSYGTALDLSNRRTTFSADGKTTVSKSVLTLAESATYTIDNVLGGSDSWDADYVGTILPAPVITQSDGTLSWSGSSNQTMCYLVVRNGSATLTTDTQCQWNGTDDITVQCVSPSGVLGLTASAKNPTGIRNINYEASTRGEQQDYSISGQPISEKVRGLHVAKGGKHIVR